MPVHVWNGGSNTSPYDTWAKAATTLETGCGYGTYTDDVWMADDHAEDPAGLATFVSGGTYTTGTRRIFSVDRATDLPSVAQNPQVNNSTGDIYFNGDWYIENCWFRTQAGNIRANSGSFMTRLWNTKLDITGTGYSLDFLANAGNIFMVGGSVNHLTSSGTITRFIDLSGSNVQCTFQGVTFTAATLVDDFVFISQAQGQGNFVGCDLSGMSVTNLQGSSGVVYLGGGGVRFLDCEPPGTLTNYYGWGSAGYALQSDFAKFNNAMSLEVHNANGMGQLDTEKSIYRTGGAGLSMKLGTIGITFMDAVAISVGHKLISLPIPASAVSVDIEIARDGSSTPFTDHDVWPCVSRPKSGNVAHIWDRGGAASERTSPSDWPSSSVAWTGLSGTSVRQTMSVNLSGSSKDGRGHIWVFFAVDNDAVYLDVSPTIN